jgi:hypothetical protein
MVADALHCQGYSRRQTGTRPGCGLPSASFLFQKLRKEMGCLALLGSRIRRYVERYHPHRAVQVIHKAGKSSSIKNSQGSL